MEIWNHFDALQSLNSAADWDTFDESRTARLVGDKRRHRELVKETRGQLRVERERVASELSMDAEEGLNRNKPAFWAIKRMLERSCSIINGVGNNLRNTWRSSTMFPYLPVDCQVGANVLWWLRIHS